MKVSEVKKIEFKSKFPELEESLLGSGTSRANFYKYGDILTIPHYVTWNQVGTEKPDYHQPEYFGLLKFV